MHLAKPCIACKYVEFRPYSLIVVGCAVNAPQVFADFEYTAAENPCPYFVKYNYKGYKAE